MARSIFVSEDGANVVKLQDPHFGPADQGIITFEELSNASIAVIVVGLEDRLNPRFQVVDTLGDRTLLNTFGRSVDTRQLSGLCYEGVCKDENRDSTGYEELIKFFDENNVTVRNTPITITVGESTARYCYLLEMQVALSDPIARIWSFNARMIVEPEKPPVFDQRLQQADAPAVAPAVPFTQANLTGITNVTSRSAVQLASGLVTRSGDSVTPAAVLTPSRAAISTGINPFVA